MGTYTISVLSALKKAYGIPTEDEYGDPEDKINQQFADKLSNIINAPELKVGESLNYVLDPLGKFLISNKLYETLDNPVTLAELLGGSQILSDFIAALKGIKVESSTSTSAPAELKDINYSDIKYGAKKDANLKAVQTFIIKKLRETDIGPGIKGIDAATYNKFISDGADGGYGPTVNAMIYYLKSGFKLADTNGKTITKELIDKLSAHTKK
jgi:hypothetical protein